jgi:hypothetical protein
MCTAHCLISLIAARPAPSSRAALPWAATHARARAPYAVYAAPPRAGASTRRRPAGPARRLPSTTRLFLLSRLSKCRQSSQHCTTPHTIKPNRAPPLQLPQDGFLFGLVTPLQRTAASFDAQGRRALQRLPTHSPRALCRRPAAASAPSGPAGCRAPAALQPPPEPSRRGSSQARRTGLDRWGNESAMHSGRNVASDRRERPRIAAQW